MRFDCVEDQPLCAVAAHAHPVALGAQQAGQLVGGGAGHGRQGSLGRQPGKGLKSYSPQPVGGPWEAAGESHSAFCCRAGSAQRPHGTGPSVASKRTKVL